MSYECLKSQLETLLQVSALEDFVLTQLLSRE